MATHQTVPTQFVSVKGVNLAYRRFGKPSSVPLLFITHFRGTMDLIDPLLTNSIANNREIILFDNSGVGHSGGTIQASLQESASTAVDFLSAIGVSKVDLLGFSMGGMIAQCIVVDHAQVVNKLVLSGTQSSYTEGMVFDSQEISEIANGVSPNEEDMMRLFFFPSNSSKALGHAWWKRVQERKVQGEERTTFVSQAGGQVQQKALGTFVSDPTFFERFKTKTVDRHILVTNGTADVMTPTPNSYILEQQLHNAQLHIYPDSGHGHLYQYPESYAKQLELFL